MAFANKIGNLFKQAITSNPSVYQAIRCMSSSKLFIGGISYNTDEQSLGDAFASYGEVVEARIIMDRETGRSRGFGFVTFASSEEASAAMTGMDGKDLHGRVVRVNYATDRTGGFRGGYGGGGYGGSGGYGGGGEGGNYGGGEGYGGGDGNYRGDNYSGGGGGGNYNVAGGGGNEAYARRLPDDVSASSGNAGGYDGSAAMGYGTGGDQYNNNLGSSSSSSVGGGFDDRGDFKDDEEPDNYAKRA